MTKRKMRKKMKLTKMLQEIHQKLLKGLRRVETSTRPRISLREEKKTQKKLVKPVMKKAQKLRESIGDTP